MKFQKNCTRRVRMNAQTDNGLSVNGPLYIGCCVMEESKKKTKNRTLTVTQRSAPFP